MGRELLWQSHLLLVPLPQPPDVMGFLVGFGGNDLLR
eukprot:CAMPEP_0172709824 /NCGR_PEP_ID=MMETSP1074-20121228/55294_1 /TAXON_ID=2916 /ORGANISM="Ceratium fusus, Strain PA161109" /LENGTH=36 /DNA_ID= /DNA_START= /DNA_END= /DNA_ORIENTATION=